MTLTVAVMRLPAMTEIPDAGWLGTEPDVTVRFVDEPTALAGADLLLLPGSRQVLNDLRWLRESGLGEVLVAHARAKGATIGFSGGYYMLGLRLEDDSAATEGLGLLPVVSRVLPGEKTAPAAAEGLSGLIGVWAKGEQLEANLLCCGSSDLLPGARPAFRIAARHGRTADETDGCMDRGGWLFGTNLQGLFGNGTFRRRYLNALRARRGIVPLEP